jgi:hypothetical protein
MGNALEDQVGGDHYRKLAIQPIEYIHRNGLGFIEGSIIKYVTRHRAKGGQEDLQKAAHLLQMLIEFDYGVPELPKMPDFPAISEAEFRRQEAEQS